jgi:hypothetical protein
MSGRKEKNKIKKRNGKWVRRAAGQNGEKEK